MVQIPQCQCPYMQQFFTVIGKKWALFILNAVQDGFHSFTEIREQIGNANTKILTDRLSELVDARILTKTENGKYIFTEDGEILTTKILEISNWWCHREEK